jgi:hypothetical protein
MYVIFRVKGTRQIDGETLPFILVAPFLKVSHLAMTEGVVNPVASDDQDNLMAENTEASILPDGFSPSEMDVICGWARQNFHHGEFIEYQRMRVTL